MAQSTQPNAVPNWKKRILIPFWIVRIAIMTISLGMLIWMAATLNDGTMYDKNEIKPAIGGLIVTILFIAVIILLDVLAIFMFANKKLSAGRFMLLNCFGTGFWGVNLIIQIASIGSSNGTNGASIGLGVFIFLSFLGLLIYSSILYHRERKARKQGAYALTNNPNTTPYNASPYNNSPYQPQTTAYTTPSHNAQELPDYQTKPSGGSADFYPHPTRPAQVV